MRELRLEITLEMYAYVEDDIKMNLKEIVCEVHDWIQPAEDRYRCC
jgi:hypothetical protein